MSWYLRFYAEGIKSSPNYLVLSTLTDKNQSKYSIRWCNREVIFDIGQLASKVLRKRLVEYYFIVDGPEPIL